MNIRLDLNKSDNCICNLQEMLLLLNFFNISFMLILGCFYFTGLCIYLFIYTLICLFENPLFSLLNI